MQSGSPASSHISPNDIALNSSWVLQREETWGAMSDDSSQDRPGSTGRKMPVLLQPSPGAHGILGLVCSNLFLRRRSLAANFGVYNLSCSNSTHPPHRPSTLPPKSVHPWPSSCDSLRRGVPVNRLVPHLSTYLLVMTVWLGWVCFLTGECTLCRK